MKTAEMNKTAHRVVSRDEWLAARIELLKNEKELTRLRDAHSRQRRELPWVKVEKTYEFDTPEGKRSLADLFAGRSQLVVYHFMCGPEWKEGCPSCSDVSDHIDAALPHLALGRLRFGRRGARFGSLYVWAHDEAERGDFDTERLHAFEDLRRQESELLRPGGRSGVHGEHPRA